MPQPSRLRFVGRPVPVMALAVLLFAAGCDRQPPLATLHGMAMGTTYSVVLPRAGASDAQPRIEALLADLDLKLSHWRPDGEVARFNAYAGTDPFPVSRQTAEVVALAQQVARMSHGALDITVAPLVDAWGFGPGQASAVVLSASQIAALRHRLGYDKVDVTLDPPRLTKRVPTLQIDLSSVAKGYAADRIGELLDAMHIEHFLVEIGGEIVARGDKAPGQPWRVGIEAPLPGVRQLTRVVPLKNRAMATSGDYRNVVQRGQERYTHLIDPRTGRPIAHHTAAVSVIADSCALADAWATALMVLGLDGALPLVAERQLIALVQTRDATGAIQTHVSDLFTEMYATE